MHTKSMLFAMVLFLAVSSLYSVSAQSDFENILSTKISKDKIIALDNILNPSISAVLTGLSLTGGTFLVNLARNNDETVIAHINRARKYFIKAFFMFLICTLLLFIFDFIEILDQPEIVKYTLIDVIVTYAFFGLGAAYLVNAAKEMYSTYGRN
ncbi:MAG: hypothetical protein D4R96_02645 [Nitrosopumilaceae archaeon]|nr:MAG: hypothetical protein D4R96_02645 [Nitrosopumilaceae archaeon]